MKSKENFNKEDMNLIEKCVGRGHRGAEVRTGGGDDKDTLYTCKSVFKYKRYEPWIG